ncbi:AAA family ATPase [Pasteurella skyensis]|uniref:endopeptidase La n=1 Tax=Phocoenobacter skyensis TaxID=97481 RepID=A0AAJ6NZU1_9PAST|nr:S16 family serine protease [Pasteurella skyensis]MDP8161821.1 AAA family ATPase [Pasteurella skyensis]MDP8171977.1 AAA family ATPase [Pasteurella skyensis]MDP8176212.1 AAA family ATPase [Pasteurella skyensis]MDP8178232.1 AAA family ATPase [Pasteurella skyensis]MDP8182160.1 AAA family ATPase [Pasteurella skyensis]
MKIIPLSSKLLSCEHHFSLNNEKVTFLDFQPNLQRSLSLFQQQKSGALLVLKTDVLPEITDEITFYFTQKNQKLKVCNELNRNQLFGYLHYVGKEQKLETIESILSQVEKGVLFLNIHSLLKDLSIWDKLKQALLFGYYYLESDKHIPSIPSFKADFKLILAGSRQDISELVNYDESLHQFANYAEVETTLSLNQKSLTQWGNYVQHLAQNLTTKTFSNRGLQQLLNSYIRESENQQLISVFPTQIKKDILGIAQFYADESQFDDISRYFEFLEQQASILSDYTQLEILSNQVHIETEKEKIGQINGLSIVEFEGVPYAFGEPLRISCNTRLGDGEIVDIEHKVELGGNIHAKGIMIAESCLSQLLELPTQLPFSASLVFEQSYGHIDGDSSSLAIFCVLVSSLAKLPLPQSIAVTGAIDQSGRILSVGGVNQKIEGFFSLCQKRGLTGHQGVVIPKSCVSHLSLKSDVISAVEEENFSIWAVSDIYEVVELLFNKSFYNEQEPEQAIFSMIKNNLEQEAEQGSSGTMFSKICKKWIK